MNIRWLIVVLSLLAALLAGCESTPRGDVPDACPSVYYWRTSLQLQPAERAFIREHGIGKLYLRMFDVVVREGRCVPSATLTFSDTLPDTLRVVPVVFLTEDCLHADTTGLATNLVERVVIMAGTHHLPLVEELQVDCDWAASSREGYYALLERIRRALQPHHWRLSVTVRLHQLAQAPPPADYGVLMLYNTGDFRDRSHKNPIFNPDDIEPYLRYLDRYALPLCVAFPNFRWQRLFHGDKFKGLLYSENLCDSTVYEPLVKDSLYRVVQGRVLHGVLQGQYEVHLSPGDEVVVTRPQPTQIVALSQRIHRKHPEMHRQTIVYHLDAQMLNNLNRYTYDSLYHP